MNKIAVISLLLILLFSVHGRSQVPYHTNIKITYVNDAHSIPPPFVEKYRPVKVLQLSKKISGTNYDTICSFKFTYRSSSIKSIETFDHPKDSLVSQTFFSYNNEEGINSVERIHNLDSLNIMYRTIDSFFYDVHGYPIKHQLSIGQKNYVPSHLDTITYLYDKFNRPITCYTTVPHEGYRKYEYTYTDDSQLEPNSINCISFYNKEQNPVYRYYNIVWSGKNYTRMMFSNPYDAHSMNEFSSFSLDMAVNDNHAISHMQHDRDVSNSFLPSKMITSTKYSNKTTFNFDTAYYNQFGDYIDKSPLPFMLDYYFNGKMSSFLSSEINHVSTCDGPINELSDTICTMFCYFYDSSEMKITADISKILIYPNPTKGEVQLSNINENDVVGYELYNMLGQIANKGNILGKSVLDLSGNGNGVFILRISLGNENIYRKIIIDK